MKLLLVEDDELLTDSLTMALSGSKYNVDCVKTGVQAKGALSDSRYDLLLLDLGLPDINGLSLLKELRLSGVTIPVIILTARDSVVEKVNGLELANDYVTKPCDFRELLARIKAALRKDVWGNKTHITVGRLQFNTDTKEVLVDGRTLALTPKEVAALSLLMRNLGSLVSKEEFIDRLATWDKELSENGVETIIHRLRQKLNLAQVEIKTVRGFGYMMEKPNDQGTTQQINS